MKEKIKRKRSGRTDRISTDCGCSSSSRRTGHCHYRQITWWSQNASSGRKSQLTTVLLRGWQQQLIVHRNVATEVRAACGKGRWKIRQTAEQSRRSEWGKKAVGRFQKWGLSDDSEDDQRSGTKNFRSTHQKKKEEKAEILFYWRRKNNVCLQKST